MIEYEHVEIGFGGKTLLHDFSLSLAKGQKAVLSGPSGRGKSTLLSLLVGFNRPTGGRVLIDGLEVSDDHIDEIRKKVAWVPQEAALPFTTVKELIETPFTWAENKEFMPTQETIFKHFDLLGLRREIYGHQLKEISGGEQQRIMVMIAALLQKPVLLLDEPTSALDQTSIHQLIDYIKQWAGVTMLAVSHDDGFAHSFDQLITL